MALEKIIEIADKAYGDGLVGRCAADNSDHGDTLALFIARELKETYNPDSDDATQRHTAFLALRSAVRELAYVLDAFDETGWDHLKKEASCNQSA